MAALKTTELRQMTDQQLVDVLNDVCRNLFHLRFQSTTEKLDAPNEIKRLRREVARIKTLQRERELEIRR